MKVILFFAAAVAIALLPIYARVPMIQNMSSDAKVDGSHDFDFLFGRWKIHNRRLRHPLTGSDEWYEFESTATESPLLGGQANLEQYDAPETPTGPIHAIALRLYDSKSGQWSINWSTAGNGAFGTPTVGSFRDGIGLFFDREEYNGRTILVKFTWTHDGQSSCRWEQAFSSDDGKTWEVNWTMGFTRI